MKHFLWGQGQGHADVACADLAAARAAGETMTSMARRLRLHFTRLSFTAEFVQRFIVTAGTLLLHVASGLFMRVAAAGVPAWQAARRRVTDASLGVD